jgi:hypothetical protein
MFKGAELGIGRVRPEAGPGARRFWLWSLIW